jgi:glyoxylase I family protein
VKPIGIHHVNVTVGDLAAARVFYVEQLGLVERTDRPVFRFDGAWLDVGAQQVHLVVGERGENTYDHFALQVTDIDAAVDELRTHGHEVSAPMATVTGRQAFLRDPWGNFIELQQPSLVALDAARTVDR